MLLATPFGQEQQLITCPSGQNATSKMLDRTGQVDCPEHDLRRSHNYLRNTKVADSAHGVAKHGLTLGVTADVPWKNKHHIL
jgi:hypothetical protein